MTDTNNIRRRVKLYMLNEDRQWDDRGTGHVSYAYVERLKGTALLVRSETDGSSLLESKIQPDTAYQKQQETLVVWSEAENYDLALSFQEKTGCDEIWEKICQVQGRDPSLDITQDIVEEGDADDSTFTDEIQDTTPPIDLPACDLSKLEEISELFQSVFGSQDSPIKREKLSLAIENDNYIKKLLDLFHMCDDLDNTDGLHHLFDIFKSIFLLNKNALYDILFADDTIMDVVGVLEYDPLSPAPAKHREYLRENRYKEVIPINNTELLRKIHQTYRVQYIQDVILPTPSVFEENLLSTLNSFVFFNKIDVVSMIQDDDKFLKSLFEIITGDEVEISRRRDAVLFLKEFCTFSQTLPPQNREGFFKALSNLGTLKAMEVIFALDDEVIKLAAIDVFSFIVEYSPSMVREYILQQCNTQEDECILINLVIEQMISDPDPELGAAVQLMGIVRLLIDPDNMIAGNAAKNEKTEFLSFFYKHSMNVLTAPLFAHTVEDKPNKDDYQTAQLLSLLLEVLAFCVEHHTYHIKNYILQKDVLRRVLILMKSRHAFLALSALRFMRRILSLKDEFYNRYIIKGSLFRPVVEAFTVNGEKYNLLNSAMIEMFEFIKTEDVKSICSHVVENHYNAFENITYVKTFEDLKLKYDQQQDRIRNRDSFDPMPTILRNNRFRRDARCPEEEEEIWFDQDDNMDTDLPDMIKTSQTEQEFDHFARIMETKKATKDNDLRDSPPSLVSKTSPININLKCSPNTSPLGSPFSSPVPSPNTSPNKNGPIINSPVSPKDGATTQMPTNKPGINLVAYDADSDEEEMDEDNVTMSLPSAKRPRLSS